MGKGLIILRKIYLVSPMTIRVTSSVSVNVRVVIGAQKKNWKVKGTAEDF